LVCTWTPNGKKFAVGSGDSKVFIGYWNEGNNWWATEIMSGWKSSVISVAFHPSGKVVAGGSADYSIRLKSCVIENHNFEDENYKGPYSNQKSFNVELLALQDAGGWVTGFAFSPLGRRLAFCVHNSTVLSGEIQDDDKIKIDQK